MQPTLARISVADYLASEERSTRKREYVDGEVYAMSGASRRHNLLASNILGVALNAAKRTKECKVFSSDMKLYVQARNSFYYPDISACCDPDDREELYLTRPCFLVEVLSPSTASIDRREKRMSYETLGSLKEYVIVDQDRLRVELYRREQGDWQGYLLNQSDDVVESSCLQLQMTLEQIYDGVELPPPGVAEEEAPEYSAAAIPA